MNSAAIGWFGVSPERNKVSVNVFSESKNAFDLNLIESGIAQFQFRDSCLGPQPIALRLVNLFFDGLLKNESPVELLRLVLQALQALLHGLSNAQSLSLLRAPNVGNNGSEEAQIGGSGLNAMLVRTYPRGRGGAGGGAGLT